MIKEKILLKNGKSRFQPILVLAVIFLLTLCTVCAGYFLTRFVLQMYITTSAKRLIDLERDGRLSKEYGYVWSEINLRKTMQNVSHKITGSDSNVKKIILPKKAKIKQNIPSLSAIGELNGIKKFSNVIQINDRNDYPLAAIKTTQNSINLNQINELLLEAILFSEDQNFYTRPYAYEFKSFIRAIGYSIWRSLRYRRLYGLQGTSTIHQQVAKFLLLKVDTKGFAYVEKSIMRKLKELKIAQALMSLYSRKEILQVYVNHCVNAGSSRIGLHDISMSLFGCHPNEIDTCQSLYLSRLIRWNKNVPEKIKPQVKIMLPNIASYLQWDSRTLGSMQSAIDTLTFKRQQQILTNYSHLVDLANTYWLTICNNNGMTKEEINSMDIANPESMIRRKGNLKINLNIDIRLQTLLESEVDDRGYGKDTVIYTDIRSGSYGHDLVLDTVPIDSIRIVSVLKNDTIFEEPTLELSTALSAGDTLITNIRYRKKRGGLVRRSVFFYKRDTTNVSGQYFAYSIMNSRTGELLAYYSRDQLGSQLISLIKNRTPNGSAVAKPILFALNYDLGIFDSTSMMTDKKEIGDTLDWYRNYLIENNDTIGMVYLNTTQEDGYLVHNHHKQFDGYDFIFNHLARSNNIIAVEAMYRLNSDLYDNNGRMCVNARQRVHLLSRIGCLDLFNYEGRKTTVTGPQIYSQMAHIVMQERSKNKTSGNRKVTPDYNYSKALGTLELTLYEQLHLFNVLYANQIIEDPIKKPSLVIKKITMAGKTVEFTDTIIRYSVFSDMKNLRPVHLGMHKRLVSNPLDSLNTFDIPFSEDRKRQSHYVIDNPLSNFAKSGTTDDIIRPYNKDANTNERTNYGIWNAVLSIELTRAAFYDLRLDTHTTLIESRILDYSKIPQKENLDITLSCIGECNSENTGPRDGKSLHRYLSKKILRTYGTSYKDGFYRNYERYLHNCTPDSIRFKDVLVKAELPSLMIAKIMKKTPKNKTQDLYKLCFVKRRFLGLRLEKRSYLKLLSYSPYFSQRSQEYLDLIEQLRRCKNYSNAQKILTVLRGFETQNVLLTREIKTAVEVLDRNLAHFYDSDT